MYPIYVLLVSQDPKFQPISVYDQVPGARVIGHFEISAPNDPKMAWSTTKSRVYEIPHIMS